MKITNKLLTATNNYKVHKGSSQHVFHKQRGGKQCKTVLSIASMHCYGIPPWSKNDENTSALFTKTSFKIEPISMLF